MLAFPEFKKNIYSWIATNDLKSVKISSSKRLEAQGYIDLGTGSFKRWVKKEWLEKGKQLRVIKYNDGNWLPVATMRYEDEPVGKKGDTYIYGKKREVLDYRLFMNYIAEIEKLEAEAKMGQLVLKGLTLDAMRQQVRELKKQSFLKGGE